MPRFFPRLGPWRFDRRFVALLLRLFMPLVGLFARCLFGARLELMDAALLLGQRRGRGGLLLAWTVSAVAVSAAAVAPATPMLFTFALGPRTLGLCFARELVELGRLT